MTDFHQGTGSGPLDQADGLRRLFASAGKAFLPLAANPHVVFGGVAIERLSAALALQDRHALIVDAADSSPPAPEASALDLSSCIETLAPQVSYLPARGLPLRYVNTRGSSARLLDELTTVAERADVVIVHAGATDLARLFTKRAARPLLLAADHPESVKHAYASLKLLAMRCGWLSCDLLLVAAPGSERVPHIAASLANCADSFIGAAVADWTVIDPASDPSDLPCSTLRRIVAAQLRLDGEASADMPPALPVPAPLVSSIACH